MNKLPLIVIMGPTGSGKTALAEEIQNKIGGQLINADAFQVYKGMDIGTAKSLRKADYKLLDLILPNEEFGVGSYIQHAIPVLEMCFDSGVVPIIVGGSGLHIRALTSGYSDLAGTPDPDLRKSLNELFEAQGLRGITDKLLSLDPTAKDRIDMKNPRRITRAIERLIGPNERVPVQLPPLLVKKFAIIPELEVLRHSVRIRIDKMLQNGWLEEVQKLMNQGYGKLDPGFRAHGYRAMIDVNYGNMTITDAIEKTFIEVRQYAKRQLTWLRKEPGTLLLKEKDIQEQIKFVIQNI